MSTRRVAALFTTQEMMEGAGVRLRRGFSNREAGYFDPFLMFDDFSSDAPEDYAAGFPWHPHRGIETVTYLLDGAVRHRDSLGNEGVITGGAAQWMTAGSGIIHEEMPDSTKGIRGFQLWVNLPKKDKMTAPQYQDFVPGVIPEVTLAPGACARVVAGELAGVPGPLQAIAGNPLYADISLEKDHDVTLPVSDGHTAFVYVIEGVLETDGKTASAGTVVLFERTGEAVSFSAPVRDTRFLLAAGAPLNEPIAWHGPIVMNTEEELREAFEDLRNGAFVRSGGVK